MVAQARTQPGRGGAIINMSSVNGVMAIPTIAGYNASKGGVNNLTRCGALVTVHCPSPCRWRGAGRSPRSSDPARQGMHVSAYPMQLEPCKAQVQVIDCNGNLSSLAQFK